MSGLVKWKGFNLTPFDEMFDELVWGKYSRWFEKKDGEYEFSIAIPGVKKEDVKAWIENNQLIVETKKSIFSITIPQDADKEKISAKINLGLLTVSVERKEKEKKFIEIT
jgi:HSP20 family molecular chaperone IbpA